ncbi:ribosome recycling factor [Bacillus licheniformis]|uniref:Ribosome-recycling factor n=3 Tax=Bacillaceae TaxID=186817 RepID=RRF_BACLD|nr:MULTISPECIES: ribosome recycling factor [Bacillus]Q65JJ6.1 RecName: Full=Ribosome-recycling factor; Short=RRF; AltName: Full=Ribosome-releasing factor [Bacillus licheniformis DSM 13 = ATCC 14580]MBJ7887383.1 ribosome recycling factor [Bacillaceae bacterium HSR45]MBY8346515.1 ribosome recycling factor [Bacillus sp. PCH94]MDP4079155.1 ribosome recycling factor [Bacillota bacterium]NBB42577.1 ribosome recycling factor [Bacillus sp. y1(2019)]AAU23408.2 ribosome recycling factor [Bacillus liche
MSTQVMNETKERMQKAISAYQRELATVRAGRANPSLLDKVAVEYYGAQTPLNQIASITVPEARMLVITPYDKTALGDIEKAIQKADLGVTPSNDGNIIRITIPPLTEERRKELAKLVKKYSEDAKVAVRNIRRDANDDLKKLEKNGEMTEDELRSSTEDVQKLTDEYVSKIDEITKDKEKEIMEV